MAPPDPRELGIASLFSGVRDAIVGVDGRTGRIVLWNPAAEALFGYAAEAVLGRSLSILGPQHSAAAYEAALASGAGADATVTPASPTELPAVRANGERIVVELLVTPVDSALGPRDWLLAVVRDVTPRRELEAAGSRLAAIVESTDDAVVSMTFDGTVMSWNPGAERIYGYTAEEMLGRSLFRLIPAERTERAREVLARVRQGERITHYETERICKDGRRIHTTISLSPIRDEAGRVAGIASIARDVTERRQLDEALRRRERQLSDAQEIAQLGSFEWDVASNALTWSDQLYQIYGLAPDELRPTFEGFLERVHPEDRAATRAAIEEAYRTGQSFEREERIVRPDGSVRLLYTRGGVVADADGRPVRIVGICQDITEQRVAEEKARQLIQEQAARLVAEATVRGRDELLSIVTHDLKNPLTSIKGRAQLLRRRLARNPARARDLADLAAIEAQADLMRRLLDQLLDATRLELGQQLPLRRERLDLVPLVKRLVEQYRTLTDRHEIVLLVGDQAVLLGHWDADRLEQVLGNLLSNAIKYSPQGGTIRVTLARTDDEGEAHAVLTVQDEGLGIPAGDLARIFEPFQRGANVADTIEGTGIGLAGARHIVEQHGGAITAESQQGVGSSFHVQLPLAAPSQRPAESSLGRDSASVRES
jgi:PAS domain S-box-containing protein